MAAVQLKDLMDPLVKIQKSTEETSEKIDKLIQVVTGSSTVGDSLNQAILAELQTQTQLLKNIAGSGGGLSSLFGKGGGGKSSLGESGDALKLLGAGTAEMAKALILFTFVPKKTVVKFQTFVVDIFKTLTEYDQKEIKQGAANLMLMGDGIMNFSKSLALSALLLIPGMVALPFLIASIGIISGLMWLLGSQEKQIKQGAKSLDRVGDAIRSFAIGLAFFAVTTFFILMEPKILTGMVASLLLIGGAVGILGLVSGTIKKGATALMLMGVGLGLFAVGYAVFALVSKFVSFEDVGKQALILGGIGLVTAGLGMFFGNVALGAISMGLIGVGLTVFSIGYGIFTFVSKGVTEEDALTQAAIIGGIGGAFALIGIPVVALAVALGAIAMGIAGLALIPLSLGLKAFQMIEWSEEESKSLATTLAGIRLAFTGGETEGGFFSKLGGAFTGVLDAGVMIASAGAYAAAGMALVSLSYGLRQWKKTEWTDEDSARLGIALGTITAAFTQAGGEPSDPGGLFGKVFGTAFSPNAVERGIDSVMGAGKALKDIAMGLTDFNNFANSGVVFGDPENPVQGTLAYNVINTVGFISKAFAAVADQGNVEGGGFFGSLFSIKRNKVEEGIRSVQGVGTELKDIADGLIKFNEFVNSDVDFDAIGKAISTTIGFVGDAFAQIGGKKEKTTTSLGFFDISWDQNTVEQGINAVKGVGGELKNIADGLMTFSKLEKPNEIAKTIQSLLESMSGTFASFYDQPEFSTRVDNFSNFITSIADRGEDGSLMKAADGFQEIANAINSVDVDKADAFRGLFEASARLTDPGRDTDALEALVDAIEDIRDAMNEQNAGGGAIGGVLGDLKSALGFKAEAAPAATENASLGESLAKLQITLNQINATMANLPADIASIEIKLPQD